MRIGLYVVCAFAALWGALAMAGLGLPVWSRVAPALVSLLLVRLLAPRTPGPRDRSPPERRRVGRLVATWSGAEVVAMLVAVNLLARTGHAAWAVSAAVFIVGLHFFPLARGLPFRAYWITGALMCAAGAAGLLVPPAQAQTLSAGLAALVLWGTAPAFPRRPAPGAVSAS